MAVRRRRQHQAVDGRLTRALGGRHARIETANFRGESAYRGASESLRVTGRLTLVGDALMHESTMTDPKTWVQPWRGELPMTL